MRRPHRTRRHIRHVTAVDLDQTAYLISRDGDWVRTEHGPTSAQPNDSAFHTALLELLRRWHGQYQDDAIDLDDLDEPARCRTPGCDDDPDSGEGWNGYCGNCADRRNGSDL